MGFFCSETELFDCVVVCLDGVFLHSVAELCYHVVVCLDGVFLFSN